MVKADVLYDRSAPVHRNRLRMEPMSLRNPRSFVTVSVQAVRCVLLCAALCFVGKVVGAADNTIHVHAQSAALTSDILSATTTGYFVGTATKSAMFANQWTVYVTGRKPVVKSTGCVTAQDLLKALVSVSTSTYPYGWADGMEYGRGYDLSRISHYVLNCGTPTVFGVTTGNWNEAVCVTALMRAERDIYETKFSSPTVVPGY